MEIVDNKIFYHFQTNAEWRTTPKLNTGDQFNTSNIPINPFVGFLFNRSAYNEAIFHARDIKNKIENNDLNSISKTEIGFLSSSIEHYGKIIRELTFEIVRSQVYPELPSRQHCLWVIPEDDKDCLNYWHNMFENSGEILTLELTGRIHKGYETYLNLGLYIELQDYFNLAHRYWREVPVQGSYEYIFEGQGRVINSAPIETFFNNI